MGYSRDTFYRYQKLWLKAAWKPRGRQPNVNPTLKNRVDEATENAVTAFAIEFPAYGRVRVSELRKKEYLYPPSGVKTPSGCDMGLSP